MERMQELSEVGRKEDPFNLMQTSDVWRSLLVVKMSISGWYREQEHKNTAQATFPHT